MRNTSKYISLLLLALCLCCATARAQQYVSAINLEKLYSSPYEQALLETYHTIDKKENLLPFFLGVEGQLSNEQVQVIEKDFNLYCSELAALQQKYNSDTRFLFRLFKEVQKKYLKTFAEYEPLSKVFSKGEYNCASATSLYALILQKLGYSFQIKLTPVHCYLLVQGKERDVLLETTDKQSGFVIGKAAIQEKQEIYRADAQKALQEAFVPGHFENLIVDVSLENMCGMQYFNTAVKYYNNRHLEAALFALSKAHIFYPANRVEALMEVCLSDMTRLQALNTKQQEMQKLVRMYISMSRN